MLHPGMAAELSKLESEERRRKAVDHRPGRRAERDRGPAAAALLVASRARHGARAIGPEARDRWAAWRVVEPDAEYRRHAA